MSATWAGQTSQPASGAGRLWMPLHRRPATVLCRSLSFQLTCRSESGAWNSSSSIFICERPVQMRPCLGPGHQARGNMLSIWRRLCVRRSESSTIAARFCVKILVVGGNCTESNRLPPPSYPQVNSDVVFYSRGKDGVMQPVRVNQTHVGRLVLTKAAGATTRRDITSQYKFPEGLSWAPKSGAFHEKSLRSNYHRYI